MKRIISLLLCLCALLGLTACGQETPATAELYAMDTVMNFTAYGTKGQAALTKAQSYIQELENQLSRTKTDSEVSLLNDAGGAETAVSADVYDLIRAAVDYSAAAGGAFDITVAPVVSAWGFTTDSYQVPTQAQLDALLPLVDSSRLRFVHADGSSDYRVTLGAGQSIDLGGIAKGYASDGVERIFREQGVDSAMISLGGNVFVRGSKPDGSAWRVAVQDPNDSSSYVGVLALSDAYAVTSGGYQRYFEQDGKRYHHIIDPATGYPAENGLVSVTVVAGANGADAASATGHGTMCDAFSTALFVMGTDKAVEFWRSGAYDFDLVLVTDDNRVLVTEGIADQFTQEEGSNYTYETIRQAAA